MTSRGLDVLSEDECLVRLHASSVGRVSVRLGDSPAILPVNYRMLGRDVVFRTDPGSKLSEALMGVQVAFEIDDTSSRESAWSVLVVGVAEEIRDSATLAEVEALDLAPWASGTRDHVVRITTRRITGRSIVPERSAASPPGS